MRPSLRLSMKPLLKMVSIRPRLIPGHLRYVLLGRCHIQLHRSRGPGHRWAVDFVRDYAAQRDQEGAAPDEGLKD